MVLASHVVFGAYGFWLPNDPRGSWSEFVASWELFRHGGEATTTDARRSVAGKKHNRELRLQTKEHLKYPAVIFNDEQIQSIGAGFQEMVDKSKYEVFACAVMPDHVHLVLGRFRYHCETMAKLLKAQASHRMIEDGNHPMKEWPKADGSFPKPWAEGCWKVFLNSAADILRAIRYVENNPVKDGRPAQFWPFVIPYAVGPAALSPSNMASRPPASATRG